MESAIVIEPNATAEYCVIWLHGLGADGNDFVDIVGQLNLPAEHKVRFVFPHAPIQPVSVNGGMRMRAWYDIYDLDIAQRMDMNGIEQSVELVNELIKQQLAKGIEAQKIILAGFSQGGLIALKAGLSLSYPLAGIMALSTYFPEDCLPESVNHQSTVLMIHGIQDGVIPIKVAEQSKQRLQDIGIELQWHSFNMAHSVCFEELTVISNWLNQTLALTATTESSDG